MTSGIFICYNTGVMKNTITKTTIAFLTIIFSLALANNVFAYTYSLQPDCIISNFKVNGSSSATISSGDSITLTWNTNSCRSVSLSGSGISTNVALNGHTTITPTASSTYRIMATADSVFYQNQTLEVSIIPNTDYYTTPVITPNPSYIASEYNYYPSQNTSNTSTTIKSTSTSIAKKATSSTSKNTAQTSNTDTGNDLTALSFRGSGGFMPSSIWQWLLVIILILVIIILSRTLVKKPSPSDHDTHAVHAH